MDKPVFCEGVFVDPSTTIAYRFPSKWTIEQVVGKLALDVAAGKVCKLNLDAAQMQTSYFPVGMQPFSLFCMLGSPSKMVVFIGAEPERTLGSLRLSDHGRVTVLLRPNEDQKRLITNSRSTQEGRVAEMEKENQVLRDKHKALADRMVAGLDEHRSSSPRSNEGLLLSWTLQPQPVLTSNVNQVP